MASFGNFHWSADFSPPGVKRAKELMGSFGKIPFLRVSGFRFELASFGNFP